MLDHPAVYSNGTVLPSISLSNPSIFSLGGDFLSFPFLWALRWCHACWVSTAPNKPVNLSAASCYHTFLLQKKRPLTSRTWVLASETTHSDNCDLSPFAVLSACSWRGCWERRGGICNFYRQGRWCVEDKVSLCLGTAFVFDMNLIILFWPLLLAMDHLSFPSNAWQKRALVRSENSISTEMKRWKI